jgi:hypothetical protein
MKKKFNPHDTDSRVLADIRELLYILVSENPHLEHAARFAQFQEERMEDKP